MIMTMDVVVVMKVCGCICVVYKLLSLEEVVGHETTDTDGAGCLFSHLLTLSFYVFLVGKNKKI